VKEVRKFKPAEPYITIDMVMYWRPCISKNEILELTGGRERLTALEICDLKHTPTWYLLWVFSHAEVLGEKMLFELVCDFADHVISDNCDPRSRKGVQARRDWLEGKITDGELKSFADAAADANIDATDAAFDSAYAYADADADAAEAYDTGADADAAVAADAAYDTADAAADATWGAYIAIHYDNDAIPHNTISMGGVSEGKWQLSRIREKLLEEVK
jgi:hypothetical protein